MKNVFCLFVNYDAVLFCLYSYVHTSGILSVMVYLLSAVFAVWENCAFFLGQKYSFHPEFPSKHSRKERQKFHCYSFGHKGGELSSLLLKPINPRGGEEEVQ